MQIPGTLKKWTPILLILAAVVFWIEDTTWIRHPSQGPRPGDAPQPSKAASANGHAAEPHAHSHEGEGDPHDDPEKNRRMGIFHYNEGNRFLKQNEWDEAVRNYKMALHHNKEFEEAHINLSTAYLKAGQLGEALETLNALKAINPDRPHLHYNLACYYSLTGNVEESLAALKDAVARGYKNWRTIDTDPDLKTLRKDSSFKEWRTEQHEKA